MAISKAYHHSIAKAKQAYKLIVLFLFIGLFSCQGQKPTNKSNLKKEETSKISASEVLHSQRFGQRGETILLIHGLGSNAKSWNKLIPYLADNFIIHTLDLPKYLDVEDKSLVSIDEYAKLVAQFIRDLNLEHAHIVGHSMGGQVAIKLAVNNPNLISSLCLLAPAGFEQFSQEDKKWFDTWVTKSFYLSLSDEHIEKSFDINFNNSKLPDDARFMLEERLALKLDSTKYNRYIDYVLAAVNSMLEQPVYNDLSNLEVASIVFFGDQDQLIPNKQLHPEMQIEDVLDVANQIPHSEKHIINNAGHFIQWDQPEEITKYLSTFIKNLQNE